MNQPLISIVIPVYNAASVISDTIQSVLNQTYKNIELILVDDHSTDNSCELISSLINKYKDENHSSNHNDHKNQRVIRLIKTSKNHGAYYVRNLGVDAAKGRFLCYLDADDLWLPDKLENQVRFMLKKHIAFSYTSYEYADCNGNPTGKIAACLNTLTFKQALKNTIVFTSTVMFDLSLIDKSLIKMPAIESEDTATWWTILRHGYTAYGIKKVYTLYRRDAGTLSSNKIRCLKRTWNLYHQFLGYGHLKSAYYFGFYVFHATFRRL